MATLSNLRRVVTPIVLLLAVVEGFVLPQTQQLQHRSYKNQHQVITDAAMVEEMTSARFAFWMCFYGAAGMGSIGRELIPIVFGRYQSNKGLVAVEGTTTTTASDDDLGIWGYPAPIYKSDVLAILNNGQSADQIANKYPSSSKKTVEEGADKKVARYAYTHIPEVEFLTYDAYVKANPNANPVALRAVFDSFTNSIGGGNSISPITAQQRIDLYKADPTKMAQKLNSGKILGVSAFILLLTLLAIADYFAIYHIWRGWFPEWQGFSHMPQSLFDSTMGITRLPEYFLSDVPKL